MNIKTVVRIFIMCILAFAAPTLVFAQTVGVFFDSNVPQIKFAADDVKTALESKSYTVEMFPLTSLNSSYANRKVVIALVTNTDVTNILKEQGGTVPTGLGEQAYGLRTTTSPQTSFWVLGGDATGAMYGGLQIAENITAAGFSGNYTSQESPYLLNRGMKLNMPLDRRIPTYVGGWSSTSTGKAIPHVWDITFWKKLIDQQARYRYNVLSVWVHHPFPALVKLADYPKASLPNIEGFNGFSKAMNHDQRVAFWREVMQYAHSRGMKFYFFNWNVYLDYAKDQYPSLTANGNNAATKDYSYKSMYALMDTYPELDGFGISAGDGMMGSEQGFNNDNNLKTQWTWEVYGKAVKDYLTANPGRKFNLIHRGIGTSVEIWNAKFAPLKTLLNVTSNYSVKYAQAHMYSTPKPAWTTSSINAINSLGAKTWLTIRNDDYFYINWGDPKFVRDYMAGIPNKNAVTGMYIGSDGYTPTRTYFYKNQALNGQLEVERRWYMEMLWGRISYNPQVSDDVFKNMLAKRFPSVSADDLFQAWTLSSRPLPRVTELIMREWSLDFDWYPEGCNSDPGRCTGFRTVYDFANLSKHPNAKPTTVANGSDLCDIPNSAANTCSGKKSSYTVADEMQADAEKALSLISTMNGDGITDLEMAINNIRQMAYLGLYYAHKVRGATFLKAGQTIKARDEMASAYCKWISYTRAMEKDYYGDSFRNMQIKPDWKFADAAVLKDYTDLGGTGSPICGDKSYKVTLSTNDDAKGSVTGAGLYNPGDDVVVNAVPKTGFRFLYWKENDVIASTNISYKFTIEFDKVFVAHFVESDGCAFPWNDAGFTVNKTTVNKTLGPIDISCAPAGVGISIDLQGVGADNSDYCKVYYKVDGGPLKPIAEINGAFAKKTVSVSGLTGNRLEIVFSSATSFGDEFYYISNISVNGPVTSNNTLSAADDIEIYPNPVTKMLNIIFSDALINRKIKIYNAAGQKVYAIQTDSIKIEVDVKKLNLKGMILVNVESDKMISNHKIIIQ
jgi:hypothetical protein